MSNILNTIFYQPLFNLLFGFVAILPGQSLGLGIIALTVLVRLLLVPTSAAAVRSQRELTLLQPKVDELRAKYKDKPEELNKKLLELYQEHNVNPFGSCLPLLIQLPILIVLYRVVMNGLHTENFSLLYSFVPTPTALSTTLFGLNLAAPNIVLAVVAAILQFLQARQMMTKQTAPSADTDSATATAQQLNRNMIYIMPLMTLFVSVSLPAALPLYWITTTLFSVVQQWWIFRTNPAVATPHVAVTVAEPHRTITVAEPEVPAIPKSEKQTKRTTQSNKQKSRTKRS